MHLFCLLRHYAFHLWRSMKWRLQIADMAENSIMLNQIYSFPAVNYGLINVCNTVTRLKFHFMRGWFVCLLLMIVPGRVHITENRPR